jgi:hypothetical protein
MRILVSGMIARDPFQGGATWAMLQYVVGLIRLGHDVTFVESIPRSTIVPSGATLERSKNAMYLRSITRDFDLEGKAALVVDETRESIGLPYPTVERLAKQADLILNISGVLRDRELLHSTARRVYVDLDPSFTQLWHSAQGIDMGFEDHTDFFTVGLAVGTAQSSVPTCGVDWQPILPPVVLDLWPTAADIVHDAFTTVANWRSYGSIDHGDIFYGQKAHSLRNLFALPQKTSETFLLALAIHEGEHDDLRALSGHGWQLIDPRRVCASPHAYRAFLQGSKAELGIAKSGYVVSRCGWFSDRSACYLASGRPVLAQDTGYGSFLPTGEGLLSFSTVPEAVAAVDKINRRYEAHARMARALAEEHFDAVKVLTGVLQALSES